MRIGIVTTWFERGAAYVSRQIRDSLLRDGNEVFIFARGGEKYARNDENWDGPHVHWSKRIESPFSLTLIDETEFTQWLRASKIDAVLFNEQRWMQPILWCKSQNVKTIAYVDYYREDTLFQFEAYDALICNTKRHFSVFSESRFNSHFVQWGTDLTVFNSQNRNEESNYTLFHSAGMNPVRKGTDLLLAALAVDYPGKVLIQSQLPLENFFPKLENKINELKNSGVLEIIEKTVPWPGLYHKARCYVYPSRLDGIGLTLLEAMATGSFVITTDEGPMNEFVTTLSGFVVPVEKRYCRWDGYYWPVSEVSVKELKKKIYEVAELDLDLNQHKKIEAFVKQNFDWTRNSSRLSEIIHSAKIKPLAPELEHKISDYDFRGIHRLDRVILRFNGTYKGLRNLLRLVK